jgi:hypothetical protein
VGTVFNLFGRAHWKTHGTSTSDDFFKAKSPRYLQNAETQHTLDEMVLNNEEGWPDAGKDIGDL